MTYNLHQLLKRKASPAARWNKQSVTQLFLDVQPTPAPPQELEQKTAKWDLTMNIGTPVANPLVASLAMEDLQKYLDGEVFDPDPTNLTFQPSDHMMTTPGTRSQPAPPKLKQPESWPLLRPGGQEIAPQGTPATQFGFPTPAMPHRPGTIPCEPTTCLQLGILMVDWGNLGRSTYGPIKQTYAPSSTTRG